MELNSLWWEMGRLLVTLLLIVTDGVEKTVLVLERWCCWKDMVVVDEGTCDVLNDIPSCYSDAELGLQLSLKGLRPAGRLPL